MQPWEIIRKYTKHLPHKFLLSNFSALDKYFAIKQRGPIYILTDSSLVTLVKSLEKIEFPALPFIDALFIHKQQYFYFQCVDTVKRPPLYPFTVQNLLYDYGDDVFYDFYGIYRDLRRESLILSNSGHTSWHTIMNTANLISRYNYNGNETCYSLENSAPPSISAQRNFLINLLCGKYSIKGFLYLNKTGFIQKYWPALYSMKGVEHTKDYHPEGDLWSHTLEALKHRKNYSLTLSLAILLHDIGKTQAIGTKNYPYKNHSELGAKMSYKYLIRLGFAPCLVKEVAFLVRYHMMPAAIHKLPLYRIEKLMLSPLFPLLLELYRADLSATFQGPSLYYQACKTYRSFLRFKAQSYKKLNLSKCLAAQ